MPPQAIYELDHYFRLEGTSATSRGTKAVCTIRYCKKPTKRFSYLGQNTSSMISHLKSCHTFEFQLEENKKAARILETGRPQIGRKLFENAFGPVEDVPRVQPTVPPFLQQLSPKQPASPKHGPIGTPFAPMLARGVPDARNKPTPKALKRFRTSAWATSFSMRQCEQSTNHNEQRQPKEEAREFGNGNRVLVAAEADNECDSRASVRPTCKSPLIDRDPKSSPIDEAQEVLVEYTTVSGLVLNASHAAASITFGDFRKIFKVPDFTNAVYVFKKSDGKWQVIGDDREALPTENFCVDARRHCEAKD